MKCFYVTGQDDNAAKIISSHMTKRPLFSQMEFITAIYNWLGPLAANYKPFTDLLTNKLVNSVTKEKNNTIVPSANDWSMTDIPNCSTRDFVERQNGLCKDCTKVNKFLKNPKETEWSFMV